VVRRLEKHDDIGYIKAVGIGILGRKSERLKFIIPDSIRFRVSISKKPYLW